MKKTVIGLNLKYIYYAFAASVLTFISIFMPFINRDDLKTNMFSLSLDILGKEVEEDEVPEKAETRCKLGDLWQLGRWVYCKKCGKKHYIS